MDIFPAMELVVSSTDKIGQDKNPNKPNIPLDHACSVCGAPASAHHHYGAVVCYPCRAFFRRGTTKSFQCRTGKFSCPLEQAVKNRCRGCRYQKCLQVGMKPEMVDATLLKKSINGFRKKVKHRMSGEIISDSDNAPLDLSRSNNDPSDDELQEATTQLFYVFNPPTQTYEPITIISLGEEDDGRPAEETLSQEASLPSETKAGSPQADLDNNIITDHEEIVQTCEDANIAGEVVIYDSCDSEVEREEIVDELKCDDMDVRAYKDEENYD